MVEITEVLLLCIVCNVCASYQYLLCFCEVQFDFITMYHLHLNSAQMLIPDFYLVFRLLSNFLFAFQSQMRKLIDDFHPCLQNWERC